MTKTRKRPSKIAFQGIGPLGQLVIALVVLFFLASGGASIANQYLGFIDLSWLPVGQRGDQTGLILGAIGVAVGLGVLLWRLVGGGRSRWAAQVLGLRSLNDIYALTPGQFEEYVGFLFHERGFDARVVGQTGDQGIDIELRRSGDPGAPRVVAQCKRYRGTVGQPIVREFYGSFADRATEGYLVTTGTFTDPAREWARSRPLHLIDGPALMQWTEEVARNLRERPSLSFLPGGN